MSADRYRLLGAALLAAALGCKASTSPPDAAIETEDIPAEVAFDPDLDPRAAGAGTGGNLAGVLPGGFPDDLPIHLPASVKGFGDAGGGLAYVAFSTADPVAAVRRELSRRLRAAGWQLPAGGIGSGTTQVQKGARVVRVHLAPGDYGTVYRYEYAAR